MVGLRWEELVGLPRDDDHVDVNRCMLRIDRVASESGGRRELRMLAAKGATAVREVVVPELAVAAVKRLLDRDADDFARLAPPPPLRPASMGLDDYYLTPSYQKWFRTAPWARLATALYYGGSYNCQTWTVHLRKARALTVEQPGREICYTRISCGTSRRAC